MYLVRKHLGHRVKVHRLGNNVEPKQMPVHPHSSHCLHLVVTLVPKAFSVFMFAHNITGSHNTVSCTYIHLTEQDRLCKYMKLCAIKVNELKIRVLVYMYSGRELLSALHQHK